MKVAVGKLHHAAENDDEKYNYTIKSKIARASLHQGVGALNMPQERSVVDPGERKRGGQVVEVNGKKEIRESLGMASEGGRGGEG